MKEKVTIYSLAKELGMTPSMVSRALKHCGNVAPEKEKIILQAAEKYNFKINKAASRLSMNPLKIGVVINSKSEHVTNEIQLGINNAYEQNKDYKITLKTIVIRENEKTKEIAECEKALFSFVDFDGVIVSGFGPSYFTDILNSFYIKNQNIVHVQSINDSSQNLFVSKHDEKLAACLAVELLTLFIGKTENKPRNVLLITGDNNSSLHSNAQKAFIENCKTQKLNVITTFDIHESEEFLRENLPRLFEKNNNLINGVYITSGNSLSLCEYLYQNDYNIPFIAFDIYEPLNDYIRNHIIWASLFQNIVGQAQNAFNGLVNYFIDEITPPKIINTDVIPVMRSNLKLYENSRV